MRPAQFPAMARRFERPATFVVVGHEELIDALVAEHPEADVEAHRDPEDRVVFASVTVDG